MKCTLCNEKIETTFLDKVEGTYIKKKPICSACQRKYSKEELLQKL